MLYNIFKKIDSDAELTKGEIEYLLNIEETDDLRELFAKAQEIKHKHAGNKIYPRALIESSNICVNDCYYCGIRKSNTKIERFTLSEIEILNYVDYAWSIGIPSIVLQSGMRDDEHFIAFIENILLKIKEKYQNKIAVTLSVDEQTKDTYKRWHEAGAERYLLRIETTNKKLFSTIHPSIYSLEQRKKCLKHLKELGYQTGTGVLIDLPNQTISDLANDIIFMKNNDIDMIGMGPFIPHSDTPMGSNIKLTNDDKYRKLSMGLKMIAVARIVMKDINIASTTALEALSSEGRLKGLLAGANVFMPNITDYNYKKNYILYDNKPIKQLADILDGINQLNAILKQNGEEILFGERGDSKHYIKKQ